MNDNSQYVGLETSPSLLLLRNCDRARYAELLSPERVEQAAAMSGFDAPWGWCIYAELERQSVEDLMEGGPRPLRLTVEDFDGGLPVVVFSIEARGVEYTWAVPMWQTAARQWLTDCIERGQFRLVLSATDESVTTTLVTGAAVMKRSQDLLRTTAVLKSPSHHEHLLHMLNAGVLLMNGAVRREPSQLPGPSDRRVMVAGWGETASQLMEAFAVSVQAARMLLPRGKQVMQ